jgi:hypothetical protein
LPLRHRFKVQVPEDDAGRTSCTILRSLSRQEDTPMRFTPHAGSTLGLAAVLLAFASLATQQSTPTTPPTPAVPTAEVREFFPGGSTPQPPAPASDIVLPPVETVSQPDEVTDEDALLRGPVHEAFAEQFNQDPEPGLIVPRQPPEPVEEVAPELRPDGRQIEWISGYWAWDDDDQDFFWVSGVWREVPQGFRWVPGYWTEVSNGWQWVSGTWVPVEAEAIDYLDEAPPLTLERGPVGVAPSSTHIWIPGCWNYASTRYVWRPGYWSVGYTNWCWVPARYLWTPRGYFFCNGYWDYPLARRGLLFAPYRFRNFGRWRPGWRFSPRVVIACNILPWSFWVRPGYRHYYFGDFYDPIYAGRGFHPWHRFGRGGRRFDPIFDYCSRSAVFGGGGFFNRIDRRYDLLAGSPDLRPFRSFARDQQPLAVSNLEIADLDGVRAGSLGRTLQDAVRDRGDARFVRLEDSTREQVREESVRLRDLATQRREIERVVRRDASEVERQIRDRVEDVSGRVRDGIADGNESVRDRVGDTADQVRDRVGRTRDEVANVRDRVEDSTDKVTDAVNDEREGRGQRDSLRTDRLKLPPVRRSVVSTNDEPVAGEQNDAANRSVRRDTTNRPENPVSRGERPGRIDNAVTEGRDAVRDSERQRHGRSSGDVDGSDTSRRRNPALDDTFAPRTEAVPRSDAPANGEEPRTTPKRDVNRDRLDIRAGRTPAMDANGTSSPAETGADTARNRVTPESRTANPRRETPRASAPRVDVPRVDVPQTGDANLSAPVVGEERGDLSRSRGRTSIDDRGSPESRVDRDSRVSPEPRANLRTTQPRTETLRPETPRTDSTRPPRNTTPRNVTPSVPRSESPRVDTPRVQTPRQESPRLESPRNNMPRVEAPRVLRQDTPRASTPKAETPRVPRTESPRPPRVESPRMESPRVNTPRPEPRVSPPPRAAEPRVSPPRDSGNRSSGGGGAEAGGGAGGGSGRAGRRGKD